MSSVERALAKLRNASGNKSTDPKRPIARVTTSVAKTSAAVAKPDLHKSIVFDLDALREAGLLSTDNTSLAEQYRAIKQPVMRKAAVTEVDGEGLNHLLMVASALSGEGKTFTCVNLSLSLAREKDWEVLLIDVDCKNPQLSRLLGVDAEPGFLDLLSDPTLDAESLVLSTSIPGLLILPSGNRNENAAELLASARMQKVCSELSHNVPNRLVIFDSSPLLLTTESTILSTHVGQIILVVLADKTPQSVVVEAIEKLDENKSIGLVLNRVVAQSESQRYGGYGSYGATSD